MYVTSFLLMYSDQTENFLQNFVMSYGTFPRNHPAMITCVYSLTSTTRFEVVGGGRSLILQALPQITCVHCPTVHVWLTGTASGINNSQLQLVWSDFQCVLRLVIQITIITITLQIRFWLSCENLFWDEGIKQFLAATLWIYDGPMKVWNPWLAQIKPQ